MLVSRCMTDDQDMQKQSFQPRNLSLLLFLGMLGTLVMCRPEILLRKWKDQHMQVRVSTEHQPLEAPVQQLQLHNRKQSWKHALRLPKAFAQTGDTQSSCNNELFRWYHSGIRHLLDEGR